MMAKNNQKVLCWVKSNVYLNIGWKLISVEKNDSLENVWLKKYFGLKLILNVFNNMAIRTI